MSVRRANVVTVGRLGVVAAVAVAMAVASRPAAAVIFTWNGGAGTWNTTSTNWNASTATWPASGTDNDALFGATSGTVTIVAGGVTANDVQFSTSGYNITSSTLTLNGSTPTITVDPSVTGTISSAIAGSAGLTKAGNGLLTLTASNGFTGGLTVSAGTVAFTNYNQLGALSGTITLNGGALQAAGSGVTTNVKPIAVGGSGGTIVMASANGSSWGPISGAGNTLTMSGTGGSTSGLMALAQTGTNVLGTLLLANSVTAVDTGTNTAITTVNVGAGSLNLSTGGVDTNVGSYGGLGAITLNGGEIRNRFGINTLPSAIALAGNGAIATRTDVGSLTLTGSVFSSAASGVQTFTFGNGNGRVGAVTQSATSVITDGTSGGRVGITVALTGTAGVATLNGTNTFSGGATVSTGTLRLGSTSALGTTTNALVVGGSAAATLDLNGQSVTVGTFSGTAPTATVTSASPVTFTTGSLGGAGTYAGSITGPITLTKVGGSTLTLSGSSSYTGGTLITGTANGITISNPNALGTGTVRLQSSSSNIQATLGLSGNVNVANAIAITGTGGRNNIFNTSGTNTLSSPVTISGGAGSQIVVFNNAVTGSSFTVAGNITGSSNFAANISFRGSAGAQTLITGTITAPASPFDVNGALDVTISSTGNSYASTTGILSTGNLILGASGALYAQSKLDVTGAGGLRMNGFNQSLLGLNSGSTGSAASITNGASTADSTLTLTPSSTFGFTGTLADGGSRSLSLVLNGSGTQTLSGTSTYTGQTAINRGTLQIAAGSALPSAAVVTLGTGSTQGFLVMQSTTASASSVTFNGTGSTVSGGRLNLVTGGTGTPLITVASGSAAWSSEANLVADTTVNVGSGATFTLGGAVTGASLTKLGSGTLSLTNASNAYGNTTILGGYVFAPANTLSSGTITLGGGSVLDVLNSPLTNTVLFTTGSGAVINSGTFVNLSGTGTILSGTGATITTNYNVTSSGSFAFVDQLAGAGINTATVQVQSGAIATLSGGVGGTGDVTILAGGTGVFNAAVAGDVNTSGISTFSSSVTGNVAVNGGTATFNTVATGTGSQVNVNAGTAVFNSAVGGLAHAETGTATVQINGDVLSTADINANAGGTVILAGSGTFGSPNIDNDGTVIFNRTGNLVLAASISGSGSVTKNDGTFLNLTGNSTYTGLTNVNSGTLAVNGSLGTTALSVAANAWLQGTGTIGGSVNVLGTLSPGNSPGVLTVGSVVLGGTSTTLIEINGLVRGTDYDGVNITGTSNSLTYGGLLSLSFGNGSAFADGTTFDIFNFTGGYLGDYASVTSTGFYSGTWSSLGGGQFQLVSGAQTLTFDQATGDIIVVPEPAAIGLVGIGIAAFGWARSRRGRGRTAS